MVQRLDVRYVRYCTDGNAARKIAPVEKRSTAKLPQVKKQKRRVICIDPFALAGIVLSVVMLVLLIVGVTELVDARQDASTMEAYTRYLEEQNAELTAQYHAKYDMKEVEQAALSLGMVPREQATHVTLQLPESEAEQENVSLWGWAYTFFAGLFA